MFTLDKFENRYESLASEANIYKSHCEGIGAINSMGQTPFRTQQFGQPFMEPQVSFLCS
jgi:hypothetical protein